MNAILGMSEVLLETELGAEQREFLTIIRDAGTSLLGIINDVLDFSKLESKKVSPGEVDFAPEKLIEETVRTLALSAHEKGLELTYRLASGVPAMAVGDPASLRQILINLVGNAIKFTARGDVAVHVDVDSVTEDRLMLHFRVTDTGIGIPEDKLAMIFEAFVQADGSNTRQFGGTGLGLAICAKLVELLSGRIWVESEPGVGSTFHFTAMVGRSQDVLLPDTVEHASDLRGVPVLIVDDNAINRTILVEMVKRWGMLPTTASSGMEALDAAREAAGDGKPFQLVLADVQMPGIDGFELVRRLSLQTGGAVPAIMMLSSVNVHLTAAQCSNLGISRYLTKPVSSASLMEAMARSLYTHETAPEPPAYEPDAVPELETILLVDDDSHNRTLALSILKKQGYRVITARDGAEAVELFTNEHVDLVLMDIQMPRMGGVEATAAIRQLEQLSGRSTPIVAVTAHALEGDKERCLAAGMNHYIAKPLRSQELLAVIRTLLARAR
jgi:CheY-like chemotaxis protein